MLECESLCFVNLVKLSNGILLSSLIGCFWGEGLISTFGRTILFLASM